MVLRNKIFLLVGLVCFSLLMIGAIIEAYHKALTPITLAGLLVSFSVITLSILYVLFAKRFDEYPKENQFAQLISNKDNNKTSAGSKNAKHKNTFYKFAKAW